MIRSLALTSLTALATASAAAQAPLEFTIDSQVSQFTYSGTTSVGPIVGNPPNFALVGDVQATVESAAGAGPFSIRFGGGGSALVSPDINAFIPAPVPIFPPVATIQITNLAFTFSSPPVAVSPAGTFTADLVATALSGTLIVNAVGQPTATSDLTGAQSLPQTFSGSVSVAGGSTTISGPLAISFLLADPALPVTATINLTGTFEAEHTSSPPSPSCVAAANSSGGPAALTHLGSPSLAAADLELLGNGIPANQFCLFVLSETSDFMPGFAGSQGNLCVGGSIFRLNGFLQNSGPMGQVLLPVPFTQLPPGASLDSGETWYFQAWFRDVAQGTPTSNTTSALAVTFAP